MQALVVIEETNRHVRALLLKQMRKAHSALAGPVDEHRLAHLQLVLQPLEVIAHGETRARHVHQSHEPENDGYGTRKPFQRDDPRHGRNRDGGDAHPLHHRPHGMAAHVPDDVPIKAERTEHRNADQRADHECRPEAADVRRHLAEPHDQGTPQRQR